MSRPDHDRLAAVKRLSSAINDPGPAPALHHRSVRNLREHWPSLYWAVCEVLRTHGEPWRGPDHEVEGRL